MDDVDAVQAQISRNMLESGDWVTARLNGVAYLEKSPLGYWMSATSYAIFGVKDWAGRLPDARQETGGKHSSPRRQRKRRQVPPDQRAIKSRLSRKTDVPSRPTDSEFEILRFFGAPAAVLSAKFTRSCGSAGNPLIDKLCKQPNK